MHPLLHSSDRALDAWPLRVHKLSEDSGLGHEFGEQLDSLAPQLDGEKGHPRKVAAGPGKAGDQAAFDRITPAEKDDRDRRGRILCRQCGEVTATGYDDVDPPLDQVGGQCGQPIILTLCPAVFDRDVLPLDIPSFAQSPVEGGHKGCKWTGRSAAEETDHRRLC